MGKLQSAAAFEAELPFVLERAGYQWINLSASVCLRAARMPGLHRDPFDRFLAAQAVELDVEILSADRRLDELGVRRLW